VYGTGPRHIIAQEEEPMPRPPASARVKLNRMYVAFAFALAPVTLGSLVVYVLASNHLISHWWLALTFGWAIVPLVILVRAHGYARRVHQARPCRSFPLA
jgi:hypothetical protein